MGKQTQCMGQRYQRAQLHYPTIFRLLKKADSAKKIACIFYLAGQPDEARGESLPEARRHKKWIITWMALNWTPSIIHTTTKASISTA